MRFVKLSSVLLVVSLSACANIDLAKVAGDLAAIWKPRTPASIPQERGQTTQPAAGSVGTQSQTPVAGSAPTQPTQPTPPQPYRDASMEQYHDHASQKIMSANAANTFSGKLPDPLASIPVLSVKLNADGSVASIDVMRTPKFYPETVEMAKAAIYRAAPFGSVSHLPRPWEFNETFLYNDNLKFQLHNLQP